MNTRKKILSLLLAAVMALSLLPTAAFAEGAQTSHKTRTTPLYLANATTNQSSDEEGWSWDADTKTLTLNGATIDISITGESAVELPDGATITTVDNTQNRLCNNERGAGIWGKGTLTINGDGELSVVGTEQIAILANGDLAINAAITAESTGASDTPAIDVFGGDIKIIDSLSITTPVGGKVAWPGLACMIVNSDGTTPASKVVIGVAAPAPAAPVFADGFGGAVTNADTYVKGETTNTKGYTFVGWFDEQGNELEDVTKAAAGVTYTARWSNNGKLVRTTVLDLTQTPVLGDTAEGWSWDAESKTLTLSGATIDVNDAPASIALPDGATVTTAKNTKNTVVNGLTGVDSGVGVLGMGKLTVNGDGQLSAAGVAAGLYAVEDLTINAPVTAKAAGADGKAVLSLEKVTLGKAVCVKTPDGGSVVNNESMGFVADKDGKAAKNVVIASADSKPPVAEKATFTDGLGNTIDNASGYVKNKTKNDKGYTFAGWVDEDGNVVDKAADAVSGKVYTARWQAGNGKLVRTTVLDLTQTNVDQKDIAEGWEWDNTTKTLTLNGATFDVHQDDGAALTAIYLPDGATITTKKGTKNIVINGSRYSAGVPEGHAFVGSAIMSAGTLKINGDGDMAITGGSCGILTMDKLTINAPISVSCTESTEDGYIYALMVHGVGDNVVAKDMISIDSSLRIKTPVSSEIVAETVIDDDFGGGEAVKQNLVYIKDKSNGKAAASVEIVKVASYHYYYSGSTTSNTPNKSPKTADAGIALYAGMAAASLLGSGVVLNRKRRNF